MMDIHNKSFQTGQPQWSISIKMLGLTQINSHSDTVIFMRYRVSHNIGPILNVFEVLVCYIVYSTLSK